MLYRRRPSVYWKTLSPGADDLSSIPVAPVRLSKLSQSYVHTILVIILQTYTYTHAYMCTQLHA